MSEEQHKRLIEICERCIAIQELLASQMVKMSVSASNHAVELEILADELRDKHK